MTSASRPVPLDAMMAVIYTGQGKRRRVVKVIRLEPEPVVVARLKLPKVAA